MTTRRTRPLAVTALLAGLLGGCTDSGPQPATYLFLMEQEPGVDPYRTRMVATDRFLRIDDGEGSRSFLLFDRGERTIYSVNAADARILVMHPGASDVVSPIRLEHRIERGTERDVPAVEGRATVHYRLFTNGEVCYDIFAVEGLVPQAHRALKEFYLTLALEQLPTIAITPKEFLTACGLANRMFAPTRHLDHGFPVRWRDMDGKTSQLVDFRLDSAPPELFELPAAFRRVTMEEMRGG